jgi:hypothetical protein
VVRSTSIVSSTGTNASLWQTWKSSPPNRRASASSVRKR